MGMIRLDAAAARARVRDVLDGADRLDEIRWPTTVSDDMPGSRVGQACESTLAEERLADVVAHVRAWAAAAQAATAALGQAESHHASLLGEPR